VLDDQVSNDEVSSLPKWYFYDFKYFLNKLLVGD
jgi:hypothetical protein